MQRIRSRSKQNVIISLLSRSLLSQHLHTHHHYYSRHILSHPISDITSLSQSPSLSVRHYRCSNFLLFLHFLLYLHFPLYLLHHSASAIKISSSCLIKITICSTTRIPLLTHLCHYLYTSLLSINPPLIMQNFILRDLELYIPHPGCGNLCENICTT
jgi:hypothetical protein